MAASYLNVVLIHVHGSSGDFSGRNRYRLVQSGPVLDRWFVVKVMEETFESLQCWGNSGWGWGKNVRLGLGSSFTESY